MIQGYLIRVAHAIIFGGGVGRAGQSGDATIKGTMDSDDGRRSLESRDAGGFQKSENIGHWWTLQGGHSLANTSR